jgi:hypothetical protein
VGLAWRCFHEDLERVGLRLAANTTLAARSFRSRVQTVPEPISCAGRPMVQPETSWTTTRRCRGRHCARRSRRSGSASTREPAVILGCPVIVDPERDLRWWRCDRDERVRGCRRGDRHGFVGRRHGRLRRGGHHDRLAIAVAMMEHDIRGDASACRDCRADRREYGRPAEYKVNLLGQRLGKPSSREPPCSRRDGP